MIKKQNLVVLPPVEKKGERALEECIFKRRSIRSFDKDILSLKELSQLLWAAGGITDQKAALRSVPSAGALYPLEIYVIAAQVEGLEPGVYLYLPLEHALKSLLSGDKRSEVASASLRQMWMKDSPAIIVFSSVNERTQSKYGSRGLRYIMMEAGCASQNLSLEAVSLGLATVMVGAFNDGEIKKILDLPPSEEPLILMPVGRNEAYRRIIAE